MKSKSVLAVFAAVVSAVSVAAQGVAFDAAQVKGLFGGTTWVDHLQVVSFLADGTLTINRGATVLVKTTWEPSGVRSVKGNNVEWTLTPNAAELHMTGATVFRIYYRGKAFPPEAPFVKKTLAQPDVVWVLQGVSWRRTFAFNGELDVACGDNGVASMDTIYLSGGRGFWLGRWQGHYLLQDAKGQWSLRSEFNGVYKPEPAQPGDPLAPQRISRAKSPFGGTTWCRLDGKGKLLTLAFAASGTTSDSAFRDERPEWVPYEGNAVRYTAGQQNRRLALDTERQRLVREDITVREVWFPGRQPPQLKMAEAKLLKETLTDESKTWAFSKAGKRISYTFDSKNVSISTADGPPTVARWEILCADCIRIGDEAFMFEGDKLERVKPRLTLQHEPKP